MLIAHRMIIKLEAGKNGLYFRQAQEMCIFVFLTASNTNLEPKLPFCQQL